MSALAGDRGRNSCRFPIAGHWVVALHRGPKHHVTEHYREIRDERRNGTRRFICTGLGGSVVICYGSGHVSRLRCLRCTCPHKMPSSLGRDGPFSGGRCAREGGDEEAGNEREMCPAISGPFPNPFLQRAKIGPLLRTWKLCKGVVDRFGSLGGEVADPSGGEGRGGGREGT